MSLAPGPSGSAGAARQLAFDLPARPALGREDFFVAPSNALAVRALADWAAWPGGKLVLVGPPGAGKTHLAAVWAGEAGAAVIDAADLAGARIDALAARRHVAVEDADRLTGTAGQQALFHLHNLVLAEGGRLLLTAASPPARWPLDLPDLVSRMQGTSLIRLEPPDDALLRAMLAKLFDDRQLAVAPGVIDYLVARMERRHAAARALVAALDARALAERRPVGLAMAAALLEAGAGPLD